MFRRILLFMAVNVLVVLTIELVLQFLGIDGYLARRGVGVSLGQLAIVCSVWGFSGAFISLALSRWIAKFAHGVEVIDPDTASGEAAALVRMVHGLAQSAHLPAMPEVGIYQSGEVNAFATGPTRSRSLVAVSTGLLETMDRRELEGVLAHEVSHIANGDMVTMTLMQGVVNSFVMFLARVISMALPRGENESERSHRTKQTLVIFVLEFVLSILGTMLVMWFSRRREFRADAGAAKLVGASSMVAALERLRDGVPAEHSASASLAAFKISGAPRWFALFSSHPPLEQRIAALRGA